MITVALLIAMIGLAGLVGIGVAFIAARHREIDQE
jgi:hypothetical protein